MKKIIIGLLVLGSFSALATECTLEFPKESNTKELKILSKKFNLRFADAEFKLGKITTDCNAASFPAEIPTNCLTTVNLLDSQDNLITTIHGKRGGRQNKSILRALEKLPNCLNGEI